MTWAENLLDASYRGVPISVMAEDLTGERSLSQHGVPYVDGDDVEDLGRGARKFALQVVFFGENYLLELQNLLRAVDTRGSGELIHPIYGSVIVVNGTYQVSHRAERPDYAEVSLQFLEHTPGQPFFAQQFDFVDIGTLDMDDEANWQDGVLDLFGRLDSLVSQIQLWIGGGWTGLIEKALGLPGITLRLQQMRSQILGVVSGVSSMTRSAPTAFDPLIDLVRTPTEIRAAIQGSMPSSSTELLSRSGLPSTVPGADSLPAVVAQIASALLTSARQGEEPSEDVLPNAMPSDPVEAVGFALVVVVITEFALSYSEAVGVVIEAEGAQPTLSPEELERLVNLVRSLIQAAILLQRRLYDIESALPVIEGLRTIAALIQVRARQVILQRPPLITRTVESTVSLRLLAHRWYGDNSRAAELLRLNPTLRTPYGITAGTVLRAYAN
jgi:prophage DNA circulation protein